MAEREIVTINGISFPLKTICTNTEDFNILTPEQIEQIHNVMDGNMRRWFADSLDIMDYESDYFMEPKSKIDDNQQYMEHIVSNSKNKGYIYFAKNSDNGFIKIGRTSGEVKKRISSLNTGRVNKIKEYKFIECQNIKWAERTIHSYFSDYRIDREWFNLDMDKAILDSHVLIDKIDNCTRSFKIMKNDYYETFITIYGYEKIKEYCFFINIEPCEKIFNNYYLL